MRQHQIIQSGEKLEPLLGKKNAIGKRPSGIARARHTVQPVAATGRRTIERPDFQTKAFGEPRGFAADSPISPNAHRRATDLRLKARVPVPDGCCWLRNIPGRSRVRLTIMAMHHSAIGTSKTPRALQARIPLSGKESL